MPSCPRNAAAVSSYAVATLSYCTSTGPDASRCEALPPVIAVLDHHVLEPPDLLQVDRGRVELVTVAILLKLPLAVRRAVIGDGLTRGVASQRKTYCNGANRVSSNSAA